MTGFDTAMHLARTDAWDNPLLGLGGAKDPSAGTRFGRRAPLDQETLHALYIENHFAAKIVEALPKHALRPGWDITVPGDPKRAADTRAAYMKAEDRLQVAGELAVGACWGRLFGGAVTWIGADDLRGSAHPLDESSIRTVRFLHTFDATDVEVYRFYDDPAHPKFRRPEVFEIRAQVIRGRGGSTRGYHGNSFLVHESRCVVWPGQGTTESRRTERGGWDDSVLERAWDALKQLGEDFGAKTLLLSRISQSIFKIKELWKIIADKGRREELKIRMQLLDRSRSRAKAIVLDAEESFENHTQPLAGVDKMLDKSILRVAAAANMPATVLMGQSPAGLDATGDGDLELWGDQAEGWQRLVLRPRHERISRLILLAEDGPTGGEEPEDWALTYNPIRRPKPKEEAERLKLEAETDAINIDKGIYPAEVAALRHGPRGASAVVLDNDELEERLERRRELSKQPPKDNAELGTIGPRTEAVLSVIGAVTRNEISRSSGLAVLTKIHRHTEEDANALLGPERSTGTPPTGPAGPSSAPGLGSGGGAPAGLPGFNDGGA